MQSCWFARWSIASRKTPLAAATHASLLSPWRRPPRAADHGTHLVFFAGCPGHSGVNPDGSGCAAVGPASAEVRTSYRRWPSPPNTATGKAPTFRDFLSSRFASIAKLVPARCDEGKNRNAQRDPREDVGRDIRHLSDDKPAEPQPKKVPLRATRRGRRLSS